MVNEHCEGIFNETGPSVVDVKQALTRLAGARVAVVGAGRSGLAACRLLSRLQAQVHLLDDAPESVLQSRLQQYSDIDSVHLHAAGISPQQLQRAQLIVLSPGVPRAHPAMQVAIRQGVPVVTELDLAAYHLPRCCFIGVTGTNGKSTVTHLLGQMLQTLPEHVFVGGNLGTPLCEVLLQGAAPTMAVLELSSFQLETLQHLPLRAAIVTNIAVDHADRYPSHAHYVHAKQRIVQLLQPNATLICSSQDAHCLALGQQQQARGRVVFVPSLAATKQLTLQETHAAFATCAAKMFAVPVSAIRQVLRVTKGLPHRFETLGCVQGVTFINDSKATNVAAAVAALRSVQHRGVHWIIGGQSKAESYEPLLQACLGQAGVKAVYGIGRERSVLLRCFATAAARVQVVDATTLHRAVQLAWQNAAQGDVILLAPACASFDQFDNFAQRGEIFRQLYADLKQRLQA